MANKPAPAPATPVATPEPAPIVPATSAPTPTPALAAKPDVADVVAQDSAVQALLGATPKKSKKAEKEPATPPAAAPEPTPEPVVAKSATTEPAAPSAPATPTPTPLKVRKPKPQSEPLTAAQIAEATATAVAKAIQPKAAEPTTVQVELPHALSNMRPVFDQLETLNPDKYKGIAKKAAEKYADFARKELAYAENWERNEQQRQIAEGKFDPANPPVYNTDDPQHAAFYNRNNPNVEIDPEDLEEARFEIKFNQRFEKRVKPKLEEAEKTISNLKATPAAAQSVDQFQGSLLSTLANGPVTPQGFKEWSEANPLEAEIAGQVQEQVAPVVHAASLLWDGAVVMDQNNATHTVAAQAFQRFEQTLDAHRDQLVDDKGRSWLPLAEYSQLSPSKQRDFFTTTKDKFVNYLALEAAARVRDVAKNQMEIIERGAKRLGYQKSQVPPVTPQSQHQTHSAPAPALVSPSVSSGAPTPPASGVAPAPVVNGVSAVGGLLGVR